MKNLFLLLIAVFMITGAAYAEKVGVTWDGEGNPVVEVPDAPKAEKSKPSKRCTGICFDTKGQICNMGAKGFRGYELANVFGGGSSDSSRTAPRGTGYNEGMAAGSGPTD